MGVSFRVFAYLVRHRSNLPQCAKPFQSLPLQAKGSHRVGVFSPLKWSVVTTVGCGMSGFVSGGSSFGAGVSVRFSRSGWAWALRAPAAGLRPAPACVFVPFPSRSAAVAWARLVAVLRFRVWVRPGARCSCWSAACAPPAPAWSVKVALPSGVSARAARASFPPVPV